MVTQMMIDEATRYNTTVESLKEQGIIFDEDVCGSCHWFASCAEFGGTQMSLAWFRAQQAAMRERIDMMTAKVRSRYKKTPADA